MILRDIKRKANGSPAPGFWYVAREDGNTYTITENILKAMEVTEQEGRDFNKRHNTAWNIAKSAICR